MKPAGENANTEKNMTAEREIRDAGISKNVAKSGHEGSEGAFLSWSLVPCCTRHK